MSSDVNVDAVFVLEAFATDTAIVQRTFLALDAAWRTAGSALLRATGASTGLRTTAAVAGCVRVAAVSVGTSTVLLGSFSRDHSGRSYLKLVGGLLLLHFGSRSSLLL